jgi:hypothetical protein
MRGELERSGRGLIEVLSHHTSICMGGVTKPTENLKIAGSPAEIRTEHLPNASIERFL